VGAPVLWPEARKMRVLPEEHTEACANPAGNSEARHPCLPTDLGGLLRKSNLLSMDELV
jgi:hypothetical protein